MYLCVSTNTCTKVADMMYGFGDEKAPQPESVAIIEDIVCDFVTRMVRLCAFSCACVRACCAFLVSCVCLCLQRNDSLKFRTEQTMEAAKLSAKRGKKLVDFVRVNICVLIFISML